MSTNTPTSSADIPAVVAAAASQRRLGQLLEVRQSPPPRSFIILLLVAGFASLAVGFGLVSFGSMIGSTGEDSATALAVRIVSYSLMVVIGPVLLMWSAIVFLRGTNGYYLYRGGLVHLKRGRSRVLPWSEITAITRRRSGTERNDVKGTDGNVYRIKAGSVVGYDVQPRRGGTLEFAVGDVFPDDVRFSTQLEQLATEARIPISG